MATLNNIDKQKLERIFAMSSGYVLDFTNRDFQDFVHTSVQKDGMGLGLHIVSEVMKAQNGLLLFPEDNEIEDYNIPAEYESGAIIILMLNKE